MADDDLSEFYKLAGHSRRQTCPIGGALEKLGAADGKKLKSALSKDNAEIPPAAIVRWLEKRGIVEIAGVKVSFSRVTSHRKGTCSCHD